MAENLDEKELEELDVQLGMVEDPAEVAQAELKAFQEAQGMTFDDPDAPVPVPIDPNAPMPMDDPGADAGLDWEL